MCVGGHKHGYVGVYACVCTYTCAYRYMWMNGKTLYHIDTLVEELTVHKLDLFQ